MSAADAGLDGYFLSLGAARAALREVATKGCLGTLEDRRADAREEAERSGRVVSHSDYSLCIVRVTGRGPRFRAHVEAAKQAGAALARADEENGCEECWEALRADVAEAGLPEIGPGARTFLVPKEWLGRACPHDAPEHAPAILIEARSGART